LWAIPELGAVAKQEQPKAQNRVLWDEYLDLRQLIERIPFSKRAIEKYISEGYLVEGVHFARPAGGKKRVFFWSAIESWLRNQDHRLRAEYARSEQTRYPFS
jgi:hypothetical protein